MVMSTTMVRRMMDEGMSDEAMLAKMIDSGMTEDEAKAMLKRMHAEQGKGMSEALIEAIDGRLVEAVPGSDGREWDVILIESGLSMNGRYYPPETLQAAAPLFDGARAFADHATDQQRRERPERSVRDLVGRFREPVYGQHQAGGRTVDGIRARFRVVNKAMRETLMEAAAMGEHDYLGFSIDAAGSTERREHQGRAVSWVTGLQRVNSVDVVTTPAAGGRLVRLVASVGVESMDPEELSKLIAEQVAAAMTASRDTLVSSVVEAVRAVPGLVAATTQPEPKPEPKTDDTQSLKEAAQQAVTEARQIVFESRVDKAIAGASGLSDMGKARTKRDLMDRFTRRAVADDEITATIKESADYEAGFRQTAPQAIGGRVQMGDERADKLVKALQGWFLGKPQDGVKPFASLQEGYCRWNGVDFFDQFDAQDMADSFGCRYQSRKDHDRLKESLSRASWGEIFADNLYVMMVKDYREAAVYDQWRKFVSDREAVPDFQTRHWARIGGYGDLPAVVEGGTYQPTTSPTDEEVTYVISKRGFLDDVTMETLIDPRSNRMRKVPQGFARSAKRTLYKFVMNLITTDDPTLDYDSVTLYDSAHANTNTTALSLSAVNNIVIAMRDQTAYNQSLEILGARNAPKFIIVPAELEARAQRILNPSDAFYTAVTDSGADTTLDPQRFKGSGIEYHVYDQLTDATDWYAVADPNEVPTLVIGFLNGNEEPELFVQDEPTNGSNFTADKVTFKCRHVYGGDILEHRSFYGQIGVS